MKFLLLSSILLLVNANYVSSPDSFAANADERLRNLANIEQVRGNLASKTFEAAKKMVLQRNLPTDWAYQHHDPTKDGYAIVKEWIGMKDGHAKKALKEKMMMNPKINGIFDWSGNLSPAGKNLVLAYENGSLNLGKYLAAKRPDSGVIHIFELHNLEIFNALVKEGFVPEGKYLAYAIELHNLDVVQDLIDKGLANRDHLDQAIFHKRLKMVKALIKAGVANRNHLSLAILCGNEKDEIIEALLEAGVINEHMIEAIQKDNIWIVNTLISGLVELDEPYLLYAISKDKLDIVKLFIQRGIANEDHLKYAIQKDKLKIVDAFFEAGLADIRLINAIQKDDVALVKYLIHEGVKIDDTYLLYAISDNKLDIVKLFIQRGIANGDHLTHAIKRGNLKIVIALINGGVKPDGDHLNTASEYGMKDMIKILKEKLDEQSVKEVDRAEQSIKQVENAEQIKQGENAEQSINQVDNAEQGDNSERFISNFTVISRAYY